MQNLIECNIGQSGLNFRFQGKDFKLVYPKEVWKKYPAKEILRDHLAHLLTISLPLVSDIKRISYKTSYPFFAPLFRDLVSENIPGAIEDYGPHTKEMLDKFSKTQFEFAGGVTEFPSSLYKPSERNVVVSFTNGKDSMLTLGLTRELGLKPACVYVNDTVSPSENRIKIKHLNEISRKFKIPCFVVRNEVEQLNDFEYWDKPETCVGYSHMVMGFCLMALPACNYHSAKRIFVGNERNMDHSFINKDGYKTYPDFLQTTKGTQFLDKGVNLISGGSVGVSSIIKPLYNLAVIKILNNRYPELARYEVSCDCLDAYPSAKRWCMRCSKCARMYVMMKAVGADPKNVGMKGGMLDKKHEKLYCLFKGKEVDFYEKNTQMRDEQLLAFYLAYKNGEKGYLMEKFSKKYLKEAQKREKTLRKRFFSIYDSEVVPSDLKSDLYKIYNKELKELV